MTAVPPPSPQVKRVAYVEGNVDGTIGGSYFSLLFLVMVSVAGYYIIDIIQARIDSWLNPWDDPSGERLRAWLGIDTATFYDASRVAILPMGYCYPGRGTGGDNPPRRECADLWLDLLLERLPAVELTLLIGQYAQRHFLGARRRGSLTETVRAWADFAPEYVPLPHPSPRNQPWFARHPWFEADLVPELRRRVGAILGG